jgi:hypothetical protein
MTAGSDIENGCASWLTERPSLSFSWASSARRVASESAAKVRSKAVSLYLTIQLSIETRRRHVNRYLKITNQRRSVRAMKRAARPSMAATP